MITSRLLGRLNQSQTIYLDAEEGGRVQERLIEEGSMVKEGGRDPQTGKPAALSNHPEQRDRPG